MGLGAAFAGNGVYDFSEYRCADQKRIYTKCFCHLKHLIEHDYPLYLRFRPKPSQAAKDTAIKYAPQSIKNTASTMAVTTAKSKAADKNALTLRNPNRYQSRTPAGGNTLPTEQWSKTADRARD